MLAQLGRHGLLDLTVQALRRPRGGCASHCRGHSDRARPGAAARHSGEKLGICRFGDALVPLDETLVRAAVDLSGLPYVVHT